MRRAMITVAAALILGSAGQAQAAVEVPKQDWSFEGIFGTYDRASAQRGLQVYKEVCAGCHSLDQIYYRNLADIGYSTAAIKAFAAEEEVQDGPDSEGEMYMRPARPSDRFVRPFPNDNAARAGNNGAFPPDLSLMVEARVGGPNYLHALLTGYSDPPSGKTVMEGMSYNKYFPGNQIAMPPPLLDDAVEYSDGTKATVEQMSRDIVTFLAWTSEPNMEERKSMGVKVMLFLFVFTGLLVAVKRRVWADVH
ncbi:MAG: Cytochrome c1 [Alphaproteobacteria bacterium MarineAlpha10_Bin3]|nr:MAG: Cytochrome c1 [Alphaproteobacteria bacterium MarineAlpha10_Bin3]PPR67549.1 MAG: Cytochrome c1 [Alphaproteobacteria bacterium MarineAlpha4_Bin1]